MPKTRSEKASAFLLGFRRSPQGDLTRYWVLPDGEEVVLRVFGQGPWWTWSVTPAGPGVPRCEGRFYTPECCALDLWDVVQALGGSPVVADRAPRDVRPRGTPGAKA
jgi:hypothetical protein